MGESGGEGHWGRIREEGQRAKQFQPEGGARILREESECPIFPPAPQNDPGSAVGLANTIMRMSLTDHAKGGVCHRPQEGPSVSTLTVSEDTTHIFELLGACRGEVNALEKEDRSLVALVET